VKEYLTGGFGGVLSFGVKGGAHASDILVDRLRIISNMTKLVT
jgi:O-acetylhomoserine/O-acetylserine sulfhydrylase